MRRGLVALQISVLLHLAAIGGLALLTTRLTPPKRLDLIDLALVSEQPIPAPEAAVSSAASPPEPAASLPKPVAPPAVPPPPEPAARSRPPRPPAQLPPPVAAPAEASAAPPSPAEPEVLAAPTPAPVPEPARPLPPPPARPTMPTTAPGSAAPPGPMQTAAPKPDPSRTRTADGNPAPPASASASARERYLASHFSYIRERIGRALVYPPIARRRGWSGVTRLAFIIGTDGAIRDLRVVSGTGYPLLDRTAAETVRRVAPFPPPPVEAEIIVPVTYRLN